MADNSRGVGLRSRELQVPEEGLGDSVRRFLPTEPGRLLSLCF